MTSEPSPREVVCRIADDKAKLYKIKVQDARDGNTPLVAACETEIVVKEGRYLTHAYLPRALLLPHTTYTRRHLLLAYRMPCQE